MFNRAKVVDENFVRFLSRAHDTPISIPSADPSAPVRDGHPLTGGELMELFESQIASRHLDLIARELRAENKTFYTIGSAGHEGNAVVGRMTRHTDPAFLHYRSGAFMMERARKIPDENMILATVLGQAASTDEPISGGRHKVWGSKTLHVPPQTSTIASHLPKAVGTAIAIGRAARTKLTLDIPPDSIVICSCGDASTQHSVAQGAFNAACYAAYQRIPVPILFVVEDNSIGISVESAPGWISANFANRPGLSYFQGDGIDIVDAHCAAVDAVQHCRRLRRPTMLHLRVVRLLGHAGTDFELEYHSMERIEADEARDPLLATARILLDTGLLTPEELLDRYESMRRRVREQAMDATSRPRLTSAEQIVAPLAPLTPDKVHAEAARPPSPEKRATAFGGENDLPERGTPRHLAVQINRALFDLMAKYDEMVLFGEDVAQKGGVYHVTAGLHRRFGSGRVFNTLLDETTILGLAQGFGATGFLPFPEIQYLAYYHNAQDQIRGEACSLQFFSNNQFRNPMVVRIASFGYQKGFGGHFHNDNSIAALRDVPGLVIAAPSRGDDAAQMLRTLAALAKVDGRVVAFLEPIALYMTKDLHDDGDGEWLCEYPPPDRAIPLGEARVYGPEADDVTIITYGNGTYLSLRAARRLEQESSIRARVVDLRWLNPLNESAIAQHALECGRVLVVDECRRTGGMAEPIITAIAERCDPLPLIQRITAWDTYTPLGPAAQLILPSESQIVEAAQALCRNESRRRAVAIAK